MLVFYDNKNISKFVQKAVASGSKSSCARTLRLSIVQSATDSSLPQIELSTGKKLQFSADGMDFFGVVSSVTRSTASSTIDVTAQDFGLYIKRNTVTHKINGMTPAAAARALCKGRGITIGYMADCNGFTFRRNFSNTSLYSAIMTGYTLAAEKTGQVYQMVFAGALMTVVQRGEIIGGTIRPKKNLLTATYSENIENVVNKVYMYDSDGRSAGTVTGDTSIGIMGQAMTITAQRGRDAAEKIIRDKKIARSGTIDILGNAECVTGNAVFVYEPYTGLYGKFYIDADTHTWANGKYTTSLTLNFENLMNEQQAGSEIQKSSRKKQQKAAENQAAQESSEGGVPGMYHVGPNGEIIYTYPPRP